MLVRSLKGWKRKWVFLRREWCVKEAHSRVVVWKVFPGEHWLYIPRIMTGSASMPLTRIVSSGWAEEGVMVVVAVWRFCVTHLAADERGCEAACHLQLCDPGIIQGCSLPVYNDGFSQLHMFEVDAHRSKRGAPLRGRCSPVRRCSGVGCYRDCLCPVDVATALWELLHLSPHFWYVIAANDVESFNNCWYFGAEPLKNVLRPLKVTFLTVSRNAVRKQKHVVEKRVSKCWQTSLIVTNGEKCVKIDDYWQN